MSAFVRGWQRRVASAFLLVSLSVGLGGVAAATSGPTTTVENPIDSDDAHIRLVGQAVLAQGWYVEEGAGVPSSVVAGVHDRLAAAGSKWALVALGGNPSQSTKFFTADLLDALRSAGAEITTVVVLTPDQLGAESRLYRPEKLDPALAAALPAFETDTKAGYEALYAQLTGAPLAPHPGAGKTSASTSQSGGGRLPLLVGAGAVIVAAGAVAGVAVAQSRKRRTAPHDPPRGA